MGKQRMPIINNNAILQTFRFPRNGYPMTGASIVNTQRDRLQGYAIVLKV